MAIISKQFDLRHTTREEIVEEIRKVEKTHRVQTTCTNDQLFTLHATPLVEAFHPDTLPGYVEFGKNLESAVSNQNRTRKMAITNAPQLGQAFRALLGEVKDQLAKATEEMNGAMSELKDATSQAVGMVKQVKTETADLKAALGLSSNNPPD